MLETKPTGIMLCGHGSRGPAAASEFVGLAAALRARLPEHLVAMGYLEFTRPSIRDGLDALYRQGVRRIFALPVMLFAGTHVNGDLPGEMGAFLAAHPEMEIVLGREIGIDAKLLTLAADRIAAAEAAAVTRVSREETLLVVAGRGATDPDANSNVSKIARLLWEEMGFGWAEVVYSGTAHPRVDEGLERVARLGFSRIIVFPYILFAGVLAQRIGEQTRRAAARFTEIEFLEANYLGNHPLLAESLADRFHALIGGTDRRGATEFVVGKVS